MHRMLLLLALVFITMPLDGAQQATDQKKIDAFIKAFNAGEVLITDATDAEEFFKEYDIEQLIKAGANSSMLFDFALQHALATQDTKEIKKILEMVPDIDTNILLKAFITLGRLKNSENRLFSDFQHLRLMHKKHEKLLKAYDAIAQLLSDYRIAQQKREEEAKKKAEKN